MEQKTHTGYLLLADISGYTFFLAQTELEHAHKAISFLLEAIVAQLGGLLTISKLEGDAVFAYIEEGRLRGGETLLGLIDATYRAFRDEAGQLYRRRTCPCKACLAIPSLDLKFMVHYGEFVLQRVAGIQDLLGTDVNLVHRLMKNHVAESTGWKAYALFTGRGLEQMRADKESFVRQSEAYEHLGEVETYVMDMHARYQGAGDRGLLGKAVDEV